MDEEGLRAKQLETTWTLLAARPVDGFPTAELSDPFSFEGYVARQIFWHMRGALGEGEAPPDAWLTHEDGVVLQQVALAVGHDALVALTDSAEAGGNHMQAARFAWVASVRKRLLGVAPLWRMDGSTHAQPSWPER